MTIKEVCSQLILKKLFLADRYNPNKKFVLSYQIFEQLGETHTQPITTGILGLIGLVAGCMIFLIAINNPPPATQKICPRCCEKVKIAAIVCCHCRHELIRRRHNRSKNYEIIQAPITLPALENLQPSIFEFPYRYPAVTDRHRLLQ